MLESNKSNNQVFYLINQIAILYTIHVVYILFETIILETSGTNVFFKTFIKGHRTLVGQPIRNLLDINGTGSNGIMVGAQVASQMLVLSMTNKTIDQIITKNLNIPTISFRSSASCKGQVEILYDLLGISIEISKDLKNKNFKKLDFNSIQKFIKIVHKT